MDDLRRLLFEIRCRNESQNHYFYPHAKVEKLVSPEAVRRVLAECKVEPYRIHEASQYITDIGGHRIFAILVLIQAPNRFIDSIKHDSLQHSNPDHKLPIKLEQLQWLSAVAAQEFYDRQWEFTAPFFSESALERVLPDNFVLPFLGKEIALGEGAFGQVFQINIEQSYRSSGALWQKEVRLHALLLSLSQLTRVQ